MTYQSPYFSQMDRQTDRQTDRHTDRQTDRQTDIQTDRQTDINIYIYISEYVQVEHVKIIQDNWSRRLPLRHNNVGSTGAPLKHIMGNELNIIQFILTYISTYITN